MNSVGNELRNQLSTLRIAGVMQASSAVMQTMSNIVCVPEMMETMQEMSVEMQKMGLIQEMADVSVALAFVCGVCVRVRMCVRACVRV